MPARMAAPSAPPPERSSAEDAARAAGAAITASIIEILRALREEIERLRHGTEQFVGRVKGSIVRSLAALQRAVVSALIGSVLVVLGVIVLSIFLVSLLNHLLGDPWGTGLTAFLLLAAGAGFFLRARSSFREMEREARALAEARR